MASVSRRIIRTRTNHPFSIEDMQAKEDRDLKARCLRQATFEVLCGTKPGTIERKDWLQKVKARTAQLQATHGRT